MQLQFQALFLITVLLSSNVKAGDTSTKNELFAVERNTRTYDEVRKHIDELSSELQSTALTALKTEVLCDIAMDYCSISLVSNALKALTAATELSPNNYRVELLRSYCAFREEDVSNARVHLEHAIQLGGITTDSQILMAMIYSKGWRQLGVEKGEADKRLDSLEPMQYSTCLLRAFIAIENQDYQAADSQIRYCSENGVIGFRVDPRFALRMRAYMEIQQKNYGNARELLLPQLKDHPKDLSMAVLASYAEGKIGFHGNAIDRLKSLESDFPDERNLLSSIGLAYQDSGRDDYAYPYLARCHRERPNSSRDLLLFVINLQRQSRASEGCKVIDEYTAQNPAPHWLEFLHACMVMSNAEASAGERDSAYQVLISIAQDNQRSFAERINSIARVYKYGDRGFAKKLTESIDSKKLSDDDKLTLDRFKILIDNGREIKM